MKNSCKEIRDLLPLYVDNMTTQIESSIIKEHLEICAECRQEYSFIKSIMVTTATLPGIEPSEGFNNKLHLKLVEEKNKNRKKLLSRFQKASVAVLTSAAVIAISVVSLNVLDKKELVDYPISQVETTAPHDVQAEIEEIYSPDNQTPDATLSPEIDGSENNKSESPVSTNKPAENTHTQDKRDRSIEQSSRSNSSHDKAPESTVSPGKITQSESILSESREHSAVTAKSYVAPNKQTQNNASKSADSTPSKSVNVPPKIKVTVNVNVKDSDLSLAKQMLSGYTYSNGAYILSASEYSQIGAKLDALGATSSITKEDKTSAYADLQMRLNNATGSKATNIRIQMNNIDNEVSKTYVTLN